MKKKPNIHDLILERFGTNKLDDEFFSKRKYWDSAVSTDDEPTESRRANPDTLSDEVIPWAEPSDDKVAKLESLQAVGSKLIGREKQVYLLLLKYPYTEAQLAEKLQVSQQRISAILQRIRQKVYKKYGSKKSELEH